MAIIWVSSSARGGDDGTSYADAYGLITDGLGDLATKGDVLNIVNDGDHTWPAGDTDVDYASGQQGTSYSDPSCTVQGTDSSGNAAMATIVSQAGGGGFVEYRGYVRYSITQNLIFDASTHFADVNAYTAIEYKDSTQGPHKTRYCSFLGAPAGQIAAGVRTFVNLSGTTNGGDEGVLEYSYAQNADGALVSQGGLEHKVDHCVFIEDNGGTRTGVIISWGTISADQVRVQECINCTVYEDSGADSTQDIIANSVGTGLDIGTANVFNNVVWTNSTKAASINPFMGGAVGSTGVTHVGTINWNLLIGGPDVAITDLTATGWYEIPWDAADDDAVDPDVHVSDTQVFETADTTVFNDPDSTYDWVLPNGLTITILKDLRLIKYQTAGRYGEVPGALGAISTSVTSPETNPNYLDVVPFFTPLLRLELNMRISTDTNRERKHYLRSDTEERAWSEYASRREVLAAGVEKRVFSGVESGEFVVMESDNAVAVNAGPTEDVWLPDAKLVAARGGDFEFLKLKNNSGTLSATTLTVMVD